jgi:transcription elongation factor GreB
MIRPSRGDGMSKAFTRESEDGLDDVLSVEDQALPPGEKNYLTPAGAARLRSQIERLRAAPRGDARRKLAIEQRLAALLRRLESTEVVDPLAQPADRVLFGATVTVRDEEDRERRYRIVGVDEADAEHGHVSWRSPIARALLNLGVGDVATAHTPRGDEELEVVRIEYLAE